MKKFLVTTSLLCFAGAVQGQWLGISLLGHGFFGVGGNQEYYAAGDRFLGNPGGIQPGFRAECLYLLPGFNAPATAYTAIGVGYLLPKTDSIVETLNRVSWGQEEVPMTQKTSQLNIGLRCGYEIPQSNDFMILHFGWGLGYSRLTSLKQLPADLDPAVYQDVDYTPFRTSGIGIELLFGVTYELEHFHLIGQYSGMAVMSGGLTIKHGITAGVFLPFKTF
jgi:hypothetical protein